MLQTGVMKICGFAVSGLANLRNLRICNLLISHKKNCEFAFPSFFLVNSPENIPSTQFTKHKSDSREAKINKLYSYISFLLFSRNFCFKFSQRWELVYLLFYSYYTACSLSGRGWELVCEENTRNPLFEIFPACIIPSSVIFTHPLIHIVIAKTVT